MKPLVAIVGRPNVGKSMLFNKLIGQRLSIVEDTPGRTRATRISGESEWCSRKFPAGGHRRHRAGARTIRSCGSMRKQAEIAIQHADVIVFPDGCEDRPDGFRSGGREYAAAIPQAHRAGGRRIELARTGRALIFMSSTISPSAIPSPFSAVHGHGTGNLLDACLISADDEEEDEDIIKVAIIGKPDVGRSSLTNRILGTERMIVSNVPGTTRDAIDSS